jgi:magnesium-transporting ATPase (P-type)
MLLAAGALCNDATLEQDEGQAGGYHAVGDPTEGAWCGRRAPRLWKPDLEKLLPRVAEAPFTRSANA